MNSLPFLSLTRVTRSIAVLAWIKVILLMAIPASVYAETQPRVISTDAGVTELLFALGMQDHLIAVDVTSQLPSDYPKLPNIGYHRTLSAEGLLSLNPSVVIGSEHTGPVSVMTALKQAKVKFVQLSSAQNSQQLADNVTTLSAALNQADRGRDLLQSVNHKLAKIARANLAGERVAFLLSMDDSKLRLAGKGTGGDSFVTLMKAANIAEFENYRNISAESLLQMQPSVIIVAGRDVDNAVDNLLAANPVLEYTPAGKYQRIAAVNGATLVAGLSVSAIDEAIRLTQQLSNTPALALQEDH